METKVEFAAVKNSGGERRKEDFDRTPRIPLAITEKELDNRETPKVAWELRIRRELEEGWMV